MKKFWVAYKWKLAIFSSLLMLIVVVVMYMRPSKTLEGVELEKIIEIPHEFNGKEGGAACEEVLAEFSKNAGLTRADKLKLGLLPLENQLKQESIIQGCIRSGIAIYADKNSAEMAFQDLRENISDIEAGSVIYDNQDNMILFSIPFVFEGMIQGSPAKFSVAEIENPILISYECNTVVSLYLFAKDEGTDWDNTFSVHIDNDEIISYANQIHDRIKDVVCPILITPNE